MIKVSKNIKKFRKQSGLTQEQLAEQMHLTRQAISNWENDKCQPDIESVARLAEVFGVSVEEMIYGSLKNVGTEENSESRINVMKIVLSVFGGLFCAAGIIILFVAFWQDFPSVFKVILSFLPVMVGAVLVVYINENKKESVVWREIGSIVWCVGVFASVSLFNSSTELFEFHTRMLICCILLIPVMLMFRCVSILPVYYLFQIIFGCEIIDSDLNVFVQLAIIPLFLAGAAYTFFVIKKEGADARFRFAVWISAIALVVNIIVLCVGTVEMLVLPSLILVAVSLCVIGERQKGYTLPFRVLGSIGICVVSLVSILFYDLEYGEYYKNDTYEIFMFTVPLAAVLLAALSIAFVRSDIKLNLAGGILYIACGAGIANSLLFSFDLGVSYDNSPIIALIIAAVIGISFVLKGINKLSLFELNVGIITVFIAFIILVFNELDFSLFTVGGLLILFGASMFFANYLVSKKKKIAAKK
ncbi:MAG: DUF2157 domain-containing protein [Eubacterium sp.]|nr:DUF2157 domain-containing protein [Eubacterium sp.]